MIPVFFERRVEPTIVFSPEKKRVHKNGSTAQKNMRLVLLPASIIFLFALLSFTAHAEPQNDTQNNTSDISLTQNVTQQIYFYLAPNQKSEVQQFTLFKYGMENPAPINITVIFFYLEFFVFDDYLNVLPNANVTVQIINHTRQETFYLKDATNRSFQDNSELDPTFIGNGTTDENGRFYMVVPHVAKYNVTVTYSADKDRSLVVIPYVYLDDPNLWTGVYVSPVYSYSSEWLGNNSYLTSYGEGDDLSTSMVDSGSRFLMGFLLFVSVLAIPIAVVFLSIWVFKKYFG